MSASPIEQDLSDYPFEAVAEKFVEQFDLTDEEMKIFFSDNGSDIAADIALLRQGKTPEHGAVLNEDRIWWIQECLIQVDRCFPNTALANNWIKAVNPGFGMAPRQILVEGNEEDLEGFSNFLQYTL